MTDELCYRKCIWVLCLFFAAGRVEQLKQSKGTEQAVLAALTSDNVRSQNSSSFQGSDLHLSTAHFLGRQLWPEHLLVLAVLQKVSCCLASRRVVFGEAYLMRSRETL